VEIARLSVDRDAIVRLGTLGAFDNAAAELRGHFLDAISRSGPRNVVIRIEFPDESEYSSNDERTRNDAIQPKK